MLHYKAMRSNTLLYPILAEDMERARAKSKEISGRHWDSNIDVVHDRDGSGIDPKVFKIGDTLVMASHTVEKLVQDVAKSVKPGMLVGGYNVDAIIPVVAWICEHEGITDRVEQAYIATKIVNGLIEMMEFTKPSDGS